MAIAKALSVSVDWLLTGRRSGMLVAADEAEWIEVPEYALLEIDEMGKMDPISSTVMRRDWLYTSLGESSYLWLATPPASSSARTTCTGRPLFYTADHQGDRIPA